MSLKARTPYVGDRLPASTIASLVQMLRTRRSSMPGGRCVRGAAQIRRGTWRSALIVVALVYFGLGARALALHAQADEQDRRIQALGAAPPGPEPAPLLRTEALEQFIMRIQYWRSPSNGPVETACWSPDGQWIATGSGDGTIAIWHAADGHLAKLWNLQRHPVRSLAWSPDGTLLVTGAAGGAVLVLDARSGQVRNVITAARYIAPAEAFAPDGRILAIAPGQGGIDLVDTRSWRVQRHLSLNAVTTAVSWSPDGALLAVGSLSGDITIINTRGGMVRKTLSGHGAGTSWHLAWSPSGHRLAAGYANGTVRIFAGPRLPLVRTLLAMGAVNTLGWSADGTLLAVTAVGAGTRIWETRTGTLIRRLDLGWDTNAVAWAPNGESFVEGTDGHELVVWQVAQPTDEPGRIICRMEPAACTALRGPSGSVPSYMGR